MSLKLPENLADIAEKELGETDETRTQALKDLRTQLEALSPDQRPFRTDDEYLIAFLRHAKFRIKKAYTRIMNMEKYRREHWDVLKDAKAEDFRESYAAGWMRILNKHDKAGRQVVLLKPSKLPDVITKEWVIKWNWWSVMRCLSDVQLQVLGQVVVEDFSDFSFLQMMGFGSQFGMIGRVSFPFTNNCAPLRVSGIYILHPPSFISVLMGMARPFMSKKMMSRVRVFGNDLSALQELVGDDVLPPEFGGTSQESPTAWLDDQAALEALEPEGNPEGNLEGNPEEKPKGNPEGNLEGNPEGKPEGNPEGNPEGKPEGNPEENELKGTQ